MDPIKTEVVVVGAGRADTQRHFTRLTSARKLSLSSRIKSWAAFCLNRGCIPSKALLHATHALTAVKNRNIVGFLLERRRLTSRSCARERFRSSRNFPAAWRNWRSCAASKSGWPRLFEDSTTLRVDTAEGQKFITLNKPSLRSVSRAALPKAWIWEIRA